MKPVIIDNFLSKIYFERIQELITSNMFYWNYKKNITSKEEDKYDFNSYGFDYWLIAKDQCNTHFNYNILEILSGFYYQLMDVTKCEQITKSRIDMVTYSPEKKVHGVHVDEYFPHIASVFYIENSDGETIIYDKQCFSHEEYILYQETIDYKKLNTIEIVEPKENRLVFFDGTYLHTGCSPSKHKNRIIINSDLIKNTPEL